MDSDKQSLLEKVFEGGLWGSRYVVVLAVVCSAISASSLFFIGSWEIFHSIKEHFFSDNDLNAIDHKDILRHMIGAIDLYLIGVVLLIFSFGIYELFISKIDINKKNTDVTILEVENIDELKQKIIKVIIMVLIVSFFERILTMEYSTPLEMMYFAISIFSLSFGVFILNKNTNDGTFRKK